MRTAFFGAIATLLACACGAPHDSGSTDSGSPGETSGTGTSDGATNGSIGDAGDTGRDSAPSGSVGSFDTGGGNAAGKGDGGSQGEAGGANRVDGSSGGQDGAGADGSAMGSDGSAMGSDGGAMGSDGGVAMGSDGSSGAPHWVGTWATAPQLTEQSNLPPSSLSNSTLRQVAHVSIGGSQLRARFSNEFGNGPLTINEAHIAVCKASPVDSSIDATADKALAFTGNASVAIAQGKAVWSDAVDFNLAALSNLSVTVAFGSVPSNVTGHPGSRTTSYEQTGSSNVSAASMSSAQTADHWYVLSGVDVMADAGTKAMVVLGDSITDGRGSTTNGNDRWPDDLARRLQGNAATAKVSILNAGIGGNTVASGGLGPTALSRFGRDVLAQSGVRWVVILEGVNDIGGGGSASPVTSGFDQMIMQAHAQNLLVYGVPILPFGGSGYDSPASESARDAINTYVKSGKFDAVIDLATPVQDSSIPPRLQASYDSGDHLHPNAAGYKKMVDSVDLSLFTK